MSRFGRGSPKTESFVFSSKRHKDRNKKPNQMLPSLPPTLPSSHPPSDELPQDDGERGKFGNKREREGGMMFVSAPVCPCDCVCERRKGESVR